MSKHNKYENDELLETVARKVWLHLNYADAVEMSIMEGKISHLVVEEIEKSELQGITKKGEEAKKKLQKAIADAESMGFSNTVKFLQGLEGDLPSDLGLVNLVFGGDPKKAAKKLGKVTSVVDKIQRAEDSFRDAIVLFGTELAKLPFSKNPEAEAKKAAEAAAEEGSELAGEGEAEGEVQTDDEGNTATPEEVTQQAVSAFREQPIRDIASNKFMTWAKGIQFPDLDTLEKAAQNSYKEPPEPEGFLGKLGGFFGIGELGKKKFAEDLLGAKLSDIIEKAQEWAAAAKEEPKPVAPTDMGDDLQALGQGDASVVSGAGGQGGQGGQGGAAGQAPAAAVQVPGVGNVPINTQTAPGFDGDAAQAEKMKPIPWSELEKTVTAPEDAEEITPELAALINDDPKSNVLFIDPEEAEKAAKEAEKSKPEGEAKKEGWVHTRSVSDWLFESSPRKRISRKRQRWVHEGKLRQTLFTEAIFYKDVAAALKKSGASEDEIPALARELAKRLENQYDVLVKDVPEVEPEAVDNIEAARKEVQAQGYTQEEVDEMLSKKDAEWERRSKEEREFLRDTLMAKDKTEVEKIAAARGGDPNITISNSNTQSLEAVFGDDSGPSGGKDKEDDKKEDEKFDKPDQGLLDKAKELGVEYKEGENPKNLKRRIARAEKKAKGESTKREVSKETKKKARDKAKELGIKAKNKDGKWLSHATLLKKIKEKEPKEAEVLEKEAGGSGSGGTKISQKQSQEQTISSAYYRRGNLVEALLGPNPRVLKTEIQEAETASRWAQLAGLEDN